MRMFGPTGLEQQLAQQEMLERERLALAERQRLDQLRIAMEEMAMREQLQKQEQDFSRSMYEKQRTDALSDDSRMRNRASGESLQQNALAQMQQRLAAAQQRRQRSNLEMQLQEAMSRLQDTERMGNYGEGRNAALGQVQALRAALGIDTVGAPGGMPSQTVGGLGFSEGALTNRKSTAEMLRLALLQQSNRSRELALKERGAQ